MEVLAIVVVVVSGGGVDAAPQQTSVVVPAMMVIFSDEFLLSREQSRQGRSEIGCCRCVAARLVDWFAARSPASLAG